MSESSKTFTFNNFDALGEEKRRLSEIANDPSIIRKSVEEFVNKDPKYTAGVIRKWMREKETVETG